MDSLTAKIKASLNLTGGRTGDFANAGVPISYTKSLSFELGAGALQANTFFSDYRTLAASAVDSLDLAGVLTDAFGQTITFTEVKAIYIENGSAVDDLAVGAGSNPFLTLFGA